MRPWRARVGSVRLCICDRRGSRRPLVLLSLEACSAREDMTAICSYDINEVSWRQVREKLAELGDHDQEVDWSDGHHFPWWVWLANTGKIRDVANDGISRVRLSVSNGRRCVVVDSVQGTYYISARHRDGKMNVSPHPRQYRG